MKKQLLSLLLAFTLLCSLSVPVFAENPQTAPDTAQLDKTVSYMMTYVEELGGPTYGHDTATLYIARSGVRNDRTAAYFNAYLESLKTALDENDGKLLNYGAESPIYYANGAAILAELGYDPTDFHGYNLIQNIRDMDRETLLAKDCITLSYVLMTFPQFADENDEALINGMIDGVLASFTETDTATGFDFWGVGPDNNQRCVTALLPFVNKRADVKEAVEKTIAWTISVIDENGFLHDSFMDAPNTDSTARGLAMFTLAGETEAANAVYKALMTCAMEDGSFAYLPGDEYGNGFATGDALEGLVYALRAENGQPSLNDLSDTAFFRAEAVKEQIAAISDTVTLDDQDEIKAIRAAYDALPELFKEKIGDVSKLTNAEKTISDLLAAQKPETPDCSGNPDTGDTNAAFPTLALFAVSALAAFAVRRRLTY